jgi:hypothetical protein
MPVASAAAATAAINKHRESRAKGADYGKQDANVHRNFVFFIFMYLLNH